MNNRKKHHQVCKLLSSLEDVVLRFGFGDFKHLAGGSSECVHTCLLLEGRARLDPEQQRAGVGLPVGRRDAARHVQQEGCDAVQTPFSEMIRMWMCFVLGSVCAKKLPIVYLIKCIFFFFLAQRFCGSLPSSTS